MNSQVRIQLSFWTFIFLTIGMAAISIQSAEVSEKRPRWTTSKLQGTPEPPSPYRLVNAFPNLRFQKPTSIEEVPGGGRLLVTEIGGRVLTFEKNPQVTSADVLIDLKKLLPGDLQVRGATLFDAEFHPDFSRNHFLYLCYVHPGEGGHTRVSRFTLTDAGDFKVVDGSERVIITWPSGGHNGGCLEFGTDGFLYISTGDGSGPNPPDGLTSGQDVSDLLGAILRIDVDQEQGDRAYSIPDDNPFTNTAGARAEIWAYGLRNPWKFGVDPSTGEIFAADNGWESWEMVHRIVRGGNCGWPVMEGRAALRTEVKVGPTPILPPVKDHPHTEANSVIGGPVYRGSVLPDLVGSFVYGDYITGTIWAIRPDRDGAYSHTTLLDSDQRIIDFTAGAAGELFVLDYDYTGQIYQLLPSTAPDRSETFPRKLSETGLFADLQTLTPAPGVLPYEVVASRWMDGAQARRWVAIPGDGTISSRGDDSLDFPEGTVFAKNVELPHGADQRPQRLEMQILHLEHGVWHPYSYLWDESGKEAHLVSSQGTSRVITSPDPLDPKKTHPRTWKVNAVNECKLCHEAGARFVLGFTFSQLDRTASIASEPNQLAWLTRQGVLGGTSGSSTDGASRLVNPHDQSQPLEDRARSYLHANCSMCHHPGGNAIVSFYLRRELPFEKLNTGKGTGIGTFGMRDAKIIVPGDPYRSVLFYRMSKLGYARMPYIGSHSVDSSGIALIEAWIQSLRSAEEGGARSSKSGDSQSQTLDRIVAESGSPSGTTEEAIRTLLASTGGSLALAARIHRGELRGAAAQMAIDAGVKSTSSDIRGLFETFVPESSRRQTLGGDFRPDVVLNLRGNADRGKLIFFSDGARCKNCHDIDDPKRSLGPTLRQINKKFPAAPELLTQIVQPSLRIDEPVIAYTAILEDGRTVTGLILEKTDDEVVFKTAELQLVRVAKKTIEDLRRSDKSLMPDRVLSDLTPQEAADLLAYLKSLGSD